MSDSACLALLLDGPLQSWGFASRFQRRTTRLHPTKSGVVGLICAAMGIGKGTDEERGWLPELSRLRMTSITIPRTITNLRPGIWRLEDFHTTGGGYDKKTQPQFIPRKASGGPCDNPTVSHRQYLLDARFGVILEGDRAVLERVAVALQNPVWGVWLGRKSCIPALPVCLKLCDNFELAWQELAHRCELPDDAPLGSFTRVTDVDRFDEGTDSLNDQPVSFGDGKSSGPDTRRFAVRRIQLIPGSTESPQAEA